MKRCILEASRVVRMLSRASVNCRSDGLHAKRPGPGREKDGRMNVVGLIMRKSKCKYVFTLCKVYNSLRYTRVSARALLRGRWMAMDDDGVDKIKVAPFPAPLRTGTVQLGSHPKPDCPTAFSSPPRQHA